MMPETVALRAERGIDDTPVMIGVDPARDAVAAMGPAQTRIGPDPVSGAGGRDRRRI